MPANYICTLDIGSSKIAACVARVRGQQIIDLFFEAAPSRGVRRGSIVDSIEFGESVAQLLKKLRQKSGVRIKYVHVGFTGENIITKHSRSIIPLAERGNKIITTYDIQRAHQQALILGSNVEEEIIHHLPFSYAIDSSGNVPNPVGLYSHRLEADVYLVCAKLSYVQTLVHAVNQAGYEAKDVSFNGILESKIVLGKNEQKGIYVVCDVGSDITELLIFNDGVLRHIDLFSFGGNDLTAELAGELKIPFELAEAIKKSHGVIGDSNLMNPEKEILFKKEDRYEPVKEKAVCEIITSRTKLFCAKVYDALHAQVPPYEIKKLFVTGRTMLQDGFLEQLENILNVPVEFGKITDTKLLSWCATHQDLSGQKYLTYLACLGLLKQILQGDFFAQSKTQPQPGRNPFLKSLHKIQELYQEYF
ncbi:MAG: cell division protein FtsA [Candidatus Omnitrophota bacterium]